jgi:hypothetical protein
MEKLYWIDRAYLPVRRFDEVVDFINFRKTVSAAIASKNALSYSSLEICQYGMKLVLDF